MRGECEYATTAQPRATTATPTTRLKIDFLKPQSHVRVLWHSSILKQQHLSTFFLARRVELSEFAGGLSVNFAYNLLLLLLIALFAP